MYNIYEKENIGGTIVGSIWVIVIIDIDVNGIVIVIVNDLELVSLGLCEYFVEKFRLIIWNYNYFFCIFWLFLRGYIKCFFYVFLKFMISVV